MSEYLEWRPPIIDRTLQDVINRTDKGRFSYEDVNRIEWNNGYLAERLRELPLELAEYRASKGIPDDPKYYPDYDHDYDPPVYWLYEAYDQPPPGAEIIAPIVSMLQMVGETAQHPVTLNRLNYIGANNLELAQLKIYQGIDRLRDYYKSLIDDDSYTMIVGGTFTDWSEDNELDGGAFDTWESPGEIRGGDFTWA